MAEKKINGRTFKTEPMLATNAMVLQARLLKAVGPGLSRLGEIFQGVGPNKSEEQKERSNAAALVAFAEIFAKSDPEEFARLVKDIIEIAMIRRPSGVYEHCDFDGDFTGHQKDILAVALFVLREQFGDFFSGLPALGSLGTPGAA